MASSVDDVEGWDRQNLYVNDVNKIINIELVLACKSIYDMKYQGICIAPTSFVLPAKSAICLYKGTPFSAAPAYRLDKSA